MDYRIDGEDMPSLEIKLKQSESVYTESGGMAWMRGNIEMQTEGTGGLGAMFGRALAGESMFLTTYTCKGTNGMITFTPESPGTIMPIELKDGESIIAQKDAFMVAEETVKLEMHFRKKFGAGLFGGEGFILQKLTGPGLVFVEIAGEVREYTLRDGETMKVDSGHIAMYEPSVNYDIQQVKGVKNILFGGEGLFLGSLTGPGKIWLQTMPLSNLAGAIRRFIPSK